MALRGRPRTAPRDSGDNLFTASVIAIDAKTGHYVWHYQETPSESFDFDSTAQITTADLLINGEKRHVVMHAPKNGIFYVLDAHTGKFISGTPFVPKVNWMSGFDANGRPILNPEANYAKTGKGFYLVGFQSHVWNPMSFNPQTGLVYLPTNYGSYPYVAELGAKMGNQLLGINIRKRPEGTAPTLEGPRSYLVAWDPVKQKEAWRQTEGTARAGTMTTAGNLVFQGTAQTQIQRLPSRYRREGLVGGHPGDDHGWAGELRSRRRAVHCGGGGRAVGIWRRRLLGAELRAAARLQARRQRAVAAESGLHTTAAESPAEFRRHRAARVG